jgi:hypothetical protein
MNTATILLRHELSTGPRHVFLKRSQLRSTTGRDLIPDQIRGDQMSKSLFQSMSDDELWRIFKDVAETLTERMNAEKQELKSRLARLDGLTAIKNTYEAAKRRPYTH